MLLVAEGVAGGLSGGVIAGFLIYLYREEIKNGIKVLYNCMFAQLEIDIKLSPKSLFAIKEEIMKKKRNRYNVIDGSQQPNYCVANGKYIVTYLNKWIFITKTDTKINISILWRDIDFLMNFMNSIYRKYCAPDKVILFYNLDKGKWNFPVFRRPRKLENIKQTSDMKKVLDDVDQFLKNENEDEYKENGMPYRKGYLLEGPTGVGKSTIIEIVAMKHNKSVYLVFLNALNMTDALLINLISTIPPYSIIVIEEIEKQLETLKKNKNNMVSEGGILTALDGPQTAGRESGVVYVRHIGSECLGFKHELSGHCLLGVLEFE